MNLIQVPQHHILDFRITRLAFFSRFAFDDLVAIDLASIGATQEAAQVRSIMLISNSASYIDLARKDTQDGVNLLVTLNIITPERAEKILNDEIQDVERPVK